MNKRNNSYIGISFIVLVFGIIFVPRIIDRLSNDDIAREESRSRSVNNNVGDSNLMYLEINGEKKKVPNFFAGFTNMFSYNSSINHLLSKKLCNGKFVFLNSSKIFVLVTK